MAAEDTTTAPAAETTPPGETGASKKDDRPARTRARTAGAAGTGGAPEAPPAGQGDEGETPPETGGDAEPDVVKARRHEAAQHRRARREADQRAEQAEARLAAEVEAARDEGRREGEAGAGAAFAATTARAVTRAAALLAGAPPGGQLDAVVDLTLGRIGAPDDRDAQALQDAVEQAVAELREATPALFAAPRTAPPPIDQGARRTVTSRGDGDWLRQQIGRTHG